MRTNGKEPPHPDAGSDDRVGGDPLEQHWRDHESAYQVGGSPQRDEKATPEDTSVFGQHEAPKRRSSFTSIAPYDLLTADAMEPASNGYLLTVSCPCGCGVSTVDQLQRAGFGVGPRSVEGADGPNGGPRSTTSSFRMTVSPGWIVVTDEVTVRFPRGVATVSVPF